MSAPSSTTRSGRDISKGVRVALAFVFGAAALVYTYGVTTGRVTESNRIDLPHLGLLVATALLVIVLLLPTTLTGLKLLEMGGFKLEMLERVKEQQAQQADDLNTIALMLPLLLPEEERKHLTRLDRGIAKDYPGGSSLRAELRRLRSMGLVKNKEGKAVGELTSDKSFDLSEYLELTPRGKDWVRRIEALEARALLKAGDE